MVAYWGKEVHIQKFKPKQIEPIKILQSYITCEGRFAFLFKYHFRFLQHLSHEAKMNLPLFSFKSLQKMSSRVKEHPDHTKQSVFHHGLIKLVISTMLRKGRRHGIISYFGLVYKQRKKIRIRRDS